jgi:hypothetical protein
MNYLPTRRQGLNRAMRYRQKTSRFGVLWSLALSLWASNDDNRPLPKFYTSKLWFAMTLAAIVWIPDDGSAQQATYFWGTVVDGSGLGPASSEMHLNNGIIAGQVNAAGDGILYEGSTISILSIGSQSVISTSIVGDNNSVDVNADQNTSNSGDVSNSGSVTFLSVTEEG